MVQSPIVIGGKHHNTLGVIQALGYKCIQSLVVLVTDENDPFVSFVYLEECVAEIKTRNSSLFTRLC